MQQMLAEYGIHIPEVLLPGPGVDPVRWAVIACDQFTAEPHYWDEAEALVGDAPSTLRMIWPEAWLSRPGAEQLPSAMARYLQGGVLQNAGPCLVLVKRRTASGTRRGLVAALDLEGYDFTPGSMSPIRATEATVMERLPARVAVRAQAPLELPHVLVLVDDPADTLLGPLAAAPGETLYDFELMLGGGHLTGTRVDDPALLTGVGRALAALGAAGQGMTFAVGDGNHSLAAAKLHWQRVKESLGVADHPARYALVEIENLHDPALGFEPIHRLVKGDGPALLQALVTELCARGQARLDEPIENGWAVEYAYGGGEGTLWLRTADSLCVEALQPALDDVAGHLGAEMDYIHGHSAVLDLGRRPGWLALALPPFDKNGLFPAIRGHGILPRKSFSMGEAREKRYYMECRAIR